jgi:4-deoxy-L-threo-5-hexosulose-uronate ketol-isomerase
MKMIQSADPIRYRTMTNAELRDAFVASGLFASGALNLALSDIDRGVVGGAMPTSSALTLGEDQALGAGAFAARREIGVVNLGGNGAINVDGVRFAMKKLDSLYIGRGAENISFESDAVPNPAKFYLVSYPAHKAYPTQHVLQSEAKRIPLGEGGSCNERVIYQSIRPGIVDTCQLVMGYTLIEEGSVWNTFPPHTHDRRSEFYFYFDLSDGQRIFHFMGTPDEVKTLILHNEEAALSPPWSMHFGVGTGAYGFVWSMGGVNQEFDDMDHQSPTRLR